MVYFVTTVLLKKSSVFGCASIVALYQWALRLATGSSRSQLWTNWTASMKGVGVTLFFTLFNQQTNQPAFCPLNMTRVHSDRGLHSIA